MWWLRLIYHSMCRVEGGLRIGVEAGARVAGVMEACVTLLLTPPGPMHLAAVGSAPLEATTLALAALSPHLLHSLIMTLLTHPLLCQPAGNTTKFTCEMAAILMNFIYKIEEVTFILELV